MRPNELIILSGLSFGDIVVMTAAVESLQRAYPSVYRTDVRTNYPAVWEHNPWIQPVPDGAQVIDLLYPGINESSDVHRSFLGAPVEYLGQQLGRRLTLRTNRPHLYLSESEQTPIVALAGQVMGVGQYWLVTTGTTYHFTNKQWPIEHYQQVIDQTRGRIRWVQVGRDVDNHHVLRGVIDLVGKTSDRELIRLAWGAAGGLGPVTALQHICAAWQKPYICLNGGREPATWVSYPYQHTLHTIGQLPCCSDRACWRSRVVPIGDGTDEDRSLCSHPITEYVRPAPACMAMIRPAEVVELLGRLTR